MRGKSIIFQHIEEYNETIRRYEPYSRILMMILPI